jgi:hypothetical protein
MAGTAPGCSGSGRSVMPWNPRSAVRKGSNERRALSRMIHIPWLPSKSVVWQVVWKALAVWRAMSVTNELHGDCGVQLAAELITFQHHGQHQVGRTCSCWQPPSPTPCAPPLSTITVKHMAYQILRLSVPTCTQAGCFSSPRGCPSCHLTHPPPYLHPRQQLCEQHPRDDAPVTVNGCV